MKHILIALALVVGAASLAVAQTIFPVITSITGNEILQNLGVGTAQYFSTKTLMTTGLAGAATVVASLPTCAAGTKGDLFVVTDASSPTYGSTLTGSSSTVALALCNGSNWTAH